VQLARVSAFVFFGLAAFGAFGWPYQWSVRTVLGVVAVGLAQLAFSGLEPPTRPSR
jgi:hypothetical protein